MTAAAALVKKAPLGNQVSSPEPEEPARPDPYAAGCPTRLLLDRIGDKWTVLVLGLIRDEPQRFNALRRAVEGLTQKMLSQTLKALERDGLVTPHGAADHAGLGLIRDHAARPDARGDPGRPDALGARTHRRSRQRAAAL